MERRAILRLIAGIGIVSGLGLEPVQARAAMTVAAALNLAGRQRMLAQRLAKAWLMLGQNVAPERARVLFDESRTAQQAGFAALQGFAPNDDVRAALAALEREWLNYRTALGAKPARANAQAIYDASERTQQGAHRLVLAYERASRAPEKERSINVAGRQRMLSQRIAKFYLFKAWDIQARAAQMEANFSRAEFSSGMHQLFAASGTDAEIRSAVEELDREWIAYRELLDARAEDAALRRALPEIADRSERVLAVAERLVALLLRQTGDSRVDLLGGQP